MGMCGASKVDALTVILTVVYIAGVVFNNVGGSMMSYAMPGYPSWLLYGTTLIYTAVFAVVAVLMKERPCGRAQLAWPKQVFYLKLAALTAANGFTFQFAAAWVSGDLSQLLSNMGMPAVLVLSLICFRGLRFSVREWVGTAIVFVAVLVGSIVDLVVPDPAAGNGTAGGGGNGTTSTTAVPMNGTTAPSVADEQSNEWYWIVLFLASTIFQAGEQIVQEQAFEAKLSPWNCVFWYNLYSLPIYVLVLLFEAVPILNGKATGTTVGQAFVNQGYAFRCFFGVPPQSEVDSGACVPGLATVWPLVFVLGYVIFFGVGAMLIQRFSSQGGAFFVVLITALGSPLAAAVFSIEAIVGTANYDSAKWYNYVSFFVIAIGVVVKGTPAASHPSKTRLTDPLMAKEEEEEGGNTYA